MKITKAFYHALPITSVIVRALVTAGVFYDGDRKKPWLAEDQKKPVTIFATPITTTVAFWQTAKANTRQWPLRQTLIDTSVKKSALSRSSLLLFRWRHQHRAFQSLITRRWTIFIECEYDGHWHCMQGNSEQCRQPAFCIEETKRMGRFSFLSAQHFLDGNRQTTVLKRTKIFQVQMT